MIKHFGSCPLSMAMFIVMVFTTTMIFLISQEPQPQLILASKVTKPCRRWAQGNVSRDWMPATINLYLWIVTRVLMSTNGSTIPLRNYCVMWILVGVGARGVTPSHLSILKFCLVYLHAMVGIQSTWNMIPARKHTVKPKAMKKARISPKKMVYLATFFLIKSNDT